MKTVRNIFLVLASAFILSSCNKDDGVTYWISFATVENPDSVAAFTFEQDNLKRMKVVEGYAPWYRPKDGQRIIAKYLRLTDKIEGGDYDYQVRLIDAYDILTKGIFDITPETQDSIGNDAVTISDIWIARDYLNVEFRYFGYNGTHFINLVNDASKTYTDGKVHLEFRHNANGDAPEYRQWGVASFDLKSLQAGNTEPISLVIHNKDFNNVEKTFELEYKWSTEVTSERSISFENEEEGLLE